VYLYGDLKATIMRHTSTDGKTQVENWRDIDPQLEKKKPPSLRIEEI
jgi:hypothetical protein